MWARFRAEFYFPDPGKSIILNGIASDPNMTHPPGVSPMIKLSWKEVAAGLGDKTHQSLRSAKSPTSEIPRNLLGASAGKNSNIDTNVASGNSDAPP